MVEKNRKTGIDIIDDVPWGTHLCQFYKTKEDLIDILAPYFKAGLENNEFCMWVCWDPLRAEEARNTLSKRLRNLDDYINKGQIEIVDYSKQYTVQGNSGFDNMKQFWIEKEKLAFERGLEGLRLAGNTYWLERNEWKDFAKYEQEVDAIIRNHKMLAICPYSLDKCGASEVIDVVSNHRFALIRREGKWELIESSERKKAEEEIKQVAREWIRTFDAISDFVFIQDRDFKFVKVNRAFCDALKAKPEDFIGKRCYEVLHKSDQPWPNCPLEKTLKDRRPHIEEVDDSNIGIPLLISTSPLFDDKGAVISVVHIAKDITKRKKMEEALRISKEKFKDLTETTTDWIWEVDKDGVYTYVSPKVKDFLGYEVSEVLDKTPLDLMPKEEAEKIGKIFKDKVINKEPFYKLENVNCHKDGHLVVLETNGIPLFDEKGQLKGYRGIDRDITERKKAEEALRESEEKHRKLFEEITDAIIIADPETGIMADCNRAALKLVQREKSELVGKHQQILHPPEEVEGGFSRSFKKHLKEGRGQVLDAQVITKKGEIKNVTIRADLFELKGKKWIQGIFRDITERKKAEERIKEEKRRAEKLLVELDTTYKKLKEMQDELLRRERIVTTGALAAGVAHEVRNPLAIIGMTVQYLQSKLTENDPKRELTEAIIKKVERLDRVTKELSSYGRTMKLNIRRHNVARCLNLSLALVKPKCRVQRIKIKKHYSRLPLIKMDDEQIDKVFLNIMDNAIQAMPKGGVLTVTTEFDEERKSVIIKIHNTGSPIEKRHIPHIFEPFYTMKKRGGGTGLGLAIAQSAVSRHGGEIGVESKSSGKDKGVAFIIRLPVYPPLPPKSQGEHRKTI